jgi:hypothetical protein
MTKLRVAVGKIESWLGDFPVCVEKPHSVTIRHTRRAAPELAYES